MLKIRFSVFLYLLLVFSLVADFMEFEIVYSANDFEIISDEYVQIHSTDCVVWGEPGTPQILVEALQVLIPQGYALVDASIEVEIWRPLVVGVPFPAQKPAILSLPSPGLVPPNISEYRKDRWFPESPLLDASAGNMSGFSIGSVLISPIRWNPVRGVCEFLESARVTIEYAQKTSISPSRRTPRGDRHWRESFAGLVINPQDINSYVFHIDPSAYDYAIISPTVFSGRFNQLLDLRRSWGLRDTVLITTDIYAAFPGIDRAEKIRNAIKTLFLSEGISFVLLVGDTSHIPARKVFAMDCLAGFYPDENEIFADLYFADLDGDWNFNSDTLYGEIADSIDMFADVHIGRFSLENATQLAGLIGKLERYETNESEEFAKSGLMLAQVLWDDPYTDGGAFKDDIVSNVFPEHFNFSRVYGAHGGSASNALDSLNVGPNLVNHAGHANIAVMCINHGSCLFLSEMEFLGNYNRPSVLYSIGCWPAAFDKDCIAERFVNNPHGGGVAFVGNSRYGWGSPGNPGRGYSEVLDKAFWEEIFLGNYTLGAAHDLSRARYVPFARWENVWRWVIFELNILGDPATGAITDFSPIDIACDIEGADVGVRVEKVGGAPASGAIVSARDSNGLLDEAMTDATGFAGLSIAGGTPPIQITSRLTANGVANETLAFSYGSGFFRWGLNPDSMNAEVGDTVEVMFRMSGGESPISSLTWSPTSNFGSPLSTIDPPTSISAGDSAVFGAVFAIPENLPRDTALVVDPQITSSTGSIGFAVSLPINTAKMRIDRTIISNISFGTDPLEIAQLWVLWKNIGTGRASASNVSTSSPDGDLNIYASPASVARVASGDSILVGPFELSWTPGIVPLPVVTIVAEYTPFQPETLHIATVPLGLSTDVETSEYPFIRNPGTLWHRSNTRANSGSFAWYCGNPSTGRYASEMRDVLRTERFILGDSSVLSFWAHAEFPNYGTDGLHVEIAGDADTVALDYIGSGGALLSFVIGWAEYRYLLDGLPFAPGDSVEIRFRFVSDESDQEEGIFIDDISLESPMAGFGMSIAERTQLPSKLSISAHPNPFNSSVTITIDGIGAIHELPMRVEIFDIVGRCVDTPSVLRTSPSYEKGEWYSAPFNKEGAEHREAGGLFVWRPDASIPSGIYLVRARTDTGDMAVKRIVLLK